MCVCVSVEDGRGADKTVKGEKYSFFKVYEHTSLNYT